MINTQVQEAASDSRTKRQQILDAAFEVFSRKGYHRATVDEIIALADTGKGTVYNYFVNKEQLFYTLVKERSAPFELALEGIANSSTTPLIKVENMIKEFLRFYVVNADLWRVLMHEVRGFGRAGYSNLSQDKREKYREGFRISTEMLARVLNEGVDSGVLRECDVNKAAYALFSVIVMVVFQNFVGDDIDSTARSIAHHFLYGVAHQ